VNAEAGVEIHLEGDASNSNPSCGNEAKTPQAAAIAEVSVHSARPSGFSDFTIREKRR